MWEETWDVKTIGTICLSSESPLLVGWGLNAQSLHRHL